MTNHSTVYLRGINSYRQGSHDSLCVYYSACMMLVSLYPELEVDFGRGDRKRHVGITSEDPLLKHKDDPATFLADWFYRGKNLSDVLPRLNALVAAHNGQSKGKPFEHVSTDAYSKTKIKIIRDSIDAGLPLMLGWNTRDMYNHCVLIHGYTSGQKNWLHVHDPGGGDDICWETLVDISDTPIELIVPQDKYFGGPRPDQIRYETGPDFERRNIEVLRYWPSPTKDGECCYQPVSKIFKKGLASQRGVA